ncbi:MAG: DUF664 domain-containing protein [Haloechinothrix sp.]
MGQRVPFTGGEKQSLHVSLDRHRDVVLWKLDGLDDEQLRRPMTPSGTSLLGLVKHLAAVEYGWFCETFGRKTEPLPFDPDDENADFVVRRTYALWRCPSGSATVIPSGRNSSATRPGAARRSTPR